MKQISCSAPGKVIITGEHSVVYGQPALLAAYNLRTGVKMRKLTAKQLLITSDKLEGEQYLRKEELVDFWQKAKEAWEEFNTTGNSSKLRQIRKNRWVVLNCAVGSALTELGDFEEGIEIKVKSALPIISGLGSSAYTAAVVIGGLGILFDKTFNLEDLREKVLEVEKIMHGRPSGADPAVVVYGGWLRYRKMKSGAQFEKLQVKKNLSKNLVLVSSGKAIESTGEMVERVNVKLKRQKVKYQMLMKRMGEVSEELIRGVERGILDWGLIKDNEVLLEKLGVVGEKARSMVKKVEAAGGAAKICGGGGVKEGSGIMLIYHHDPLILEKLIEREGWQSFKAQLGGRGWYRE